jgi:hypothetical protein
VDMTKENDVYSSGLFAQIGYTQNQLSESGKVMLLAANGVIASNAEAGGICGDLSVGEIYGCSFTGTVKGYTAGGICGNAGQNTIISQCFLQETYRERILRQESVAKVHLKLLIIALV